MFASEHCVGRANYVQPTTNPQSLRSLRTSFKHVTHPKSFNYRHHKKNTEFPNKFCRIKDNSFTPSVACKNKTRVIDL